ncbi:protein phosphatase [Granulicella aggregans]|uniref:Protein phosphatase n=1 Tax=Granulicella aggregans TaxID=474949 RepID=A0A7W7ZI71_9BACT|nr:protein phosphatase 2C domain-containing protein [Granulicella aggregans]MBB5060367.1 protein phosphatase [Granulicella aggregans]
MSDVGRHRSNNEDCFGYDLNARLFVVCDGMGGMAGGALASSLAVERVLDTYGALIPSPMQPEDRLHAAIAAANDIVWSTADETPTLKGMGTTLVAACIEDRRIVIGNVGDSRGYFLRAGCCMQITEDHSLRAEEIRRQRDTGEPANLALAPEFITRAIGAGPEVRPDYFAAELQTGDSILLATDGLTRYVDEQQIRHAIESSDAAQEVCNGLIGIAHTAGAADNVTCLLIRIH